MYIFIVFIYLFIYLFISYLYFYLLIYLVLLIDLFILLRICLLFSYYLSIYLFIFDLYFYLLIYLCHLFFLHFIEIFLQLWIHKKIRNGTSLLSDRHMDRTFYGVCLRHRWRATLIMGYPDNVVTYFAVK